MSVIGFKPQKGKALDKLPQKTVAELYSKQYILSPKYDGNQIFIVKLAGNFRFFTSDWKEFYISVVAEDLEFLEGNFVMVGEFMHDCKGMLGDRPKSAILTTYRTNFAKGITNNIEDEQKSNIRVFDYLEIVGGVAVDTEVPYHERLSRATVELMSTEYVNAVPNYLVTYEEAMWKTQVWVNAGWEGSMLVEPLSTYHIGKRVNHSIKLKYRKTADLKCVAVELGEGKYHNMIGSLRLEDSNGVTVSVGSGLTDAERDLPSDHFLGKVVEINYEQMIDTYIQPTYVRIRDDKTLEEID